MNDEKVTNELKKAAEVLNMEHSAIEEKYNEICGQHGLESGPIALNLFRQWFSGVKRVSDSGEEPKQQSQGSDNHTFCGYVIATEELRDFEEYNRTQLKAAIIRDSNSAFNAGKYARVEKTEEGYVAPKIVDNDVKTIKIDSRDEVFIEAIMDVNGQLVLPLDDQELRFGSPNKQFGKPKPLNNFVRGVHLIGQIGGGEIQYWRLSTKNDAAKDWAVDTERAFYVDVYGNQDMLDSGRISSPNMESVVYNDEMENPQPMNGNLQQLIAENMRGFVCPLVNLENYHTNNKHRPAAQRLVVTDGNVTNMYMKANRNGNRTLYVSDLNADFDYDNPSSATPCWVPEHVDLDFGIGSHILVIGRTNQSTNQETGELRQCSINVFGVVVLNRMGSPNTTPDSGETYTDWF